MVGADTGTVTEVVVGLMVVKNAGVAEVVGLLPPQLDAREHGVFERVRSVRRTVRSVWLNRFRRCVALL